MSEYELGKDVSSLLSRVAEIENRLEEIEEFELCGAHGEPLASIAPEMTIGTDDAGVEHITLRWGGDWWCHAMEQKSSTLRVYSTGAYESSTVLKDHSRHRKYGNSMTFRIVIKDTGSVICTLGSFSGNFSPGEEKTYRTSGSSSCAKDNYALLKAGRAGGSLSWTCWKRN